MRHRLIEFMVGQTVFSGAAPGRRLLSALLAATPLVDLPTPAFLDFAGVEVATASFLRETVIGFRDYARMSLPNIYPAVANLSAAVAEELDFFVRARGDVLWSCNLDSKDNITAAKLIGDLDPAQRTTFDAVRQMGTISAPELATQFAAEGIGSTAWNNRLSALAGKGLLIERRQGKSKSFSPLLEIV